jgi:hypothetical protein
MMVATEEVYWVITDQSHQSFLRLADLGDGEDAPFETVKPLRAARFNRLSQAVTALDKHSGFCRSRRIDQIVEVHCKLTYVETGQEAPNVADKDATN